VVIMVRQRRPRLQATGERQEQDEPESRRGALETMGTTQLSTAQVQYIVEKQ
jgi:hypothetical protein